jgi:outer membrane protein
MQNSFVNTTTVSSSDYIMFNGNTYPVMKQQQNFRTEKITYGNQVKNNIASSIGLNLRIPLFNSLQARNKIKLAKIQLSSAELQESTAKIQLRQFIDQAYINMQAAFNKYKILLEQVEVYKKSYDAAEIRFDAGVGTSIDYITAKNNYGRAKINQVTARYDYLLRTHVLDYYQGKQDW